MISYFQFLLQHDLSILCEELWGLGAVRWKKFYTFPAERTDFCII